MNFPSVLLGSRNLGNVCGRKRADAGLLSVLALLDAIEQHRALQGNPPGDR